MSSSSRLALHGLGFYISQCANSSWEVVNGEKVVQFFNDDADKEYLEQEQEKEVANFVAAGQRLQG